MLVTSQLKSMMEFMIVKPVKRWLDAGKKDAFNSARFVRFVRSFTRSTCRVKYTLGE